MPPGELHLPRLDHWSKGHTPGSPPGNLGTWPLSPHPCGQATAEWLVDLGSPGTMRLTWAQWYKVTLGRRGTYGCCLYPGVLCVPGQAERGGRGVPWGRSQQEPWGRGYRGALGTLRRPRREGWDCETVSRPALSPSVFLPVSHQPHPLRWPRLSAGCLTARVGTRQGTRVTEKRHQLLAGQGPEAPGPIGKG